MIKFTFRESMLLCIILLLYVQNSHANPGPPFNTDDPQPVDFKHWEYYISSINTFQPDAWSGTSPHFEVNYGLFPNLQVHLLLPMNYSYINNRDANFGYSSTEFGVKYCFIKETDNSPQIGTFPIIEIPTIKNSAFSDGNAQFFIPLWIQKSWNKFTTYGGIGYWIRPGINNKDSIFSGWELQYDFSDKLTLGGEIYYHSAEAANQKSVTAFNLGGSINFSSKTHFIFSVGHSILNESFTTTYLGLLWTI
jgi:hypothetical protein